MGKGLAVMIAILIPSFLWTLEWVRWQMGLPISGEEAISFYLLIALEGWLVASALAGDPGKGRTRLLGWGGFLLLVPATWPVVFEVVGLARSPNPDLESGSLVHLGLAAVVLGILVLLVAVQLLRERGNGLAWLLVLVHTLVIYNSIPFIRHYTNFLRSRGMLGNSILTAAIVTGVLVVGYLAAIRREKRWQAYLAVLAFAGVYAGCFKLLPLPEERVHFPQYGFLALFTWRAVTLSRPGDPFAFLWSLLLVAFLGWGDEGIQDILPDRFFDPRDIMLNILAGSLPLALIQVIRPRTTGSQAP